MNAIFLQILDMSITASYVILAVLIIRLLLHKAPKKYSYLLWSVVAFRLCCPFSFQAPFSLLNLRKLLPDKVSESLQFVSDNLTDNSATSVTPGIVGTNMNGTTISEIITSGNSTPATVMPSNPTTTIGSDITTELAPNGAPISAIANPLNEKTFLLEHLIVFLWIAGILALFIYSLIRYFKLRRELRTAIVLRENIYQSDQVCSPFILGFVKPRIYIPFGLNKDSLAYVLEHERYHIKRRDYLIKPFAFALLCLHWFNPLCWLAFYLMSKDMEMSCDEKVLSCNENIRKSYSTTLLSFAANHRFPTPSPLAFGESGVKSRIKNALNWKRPGIWITTTAVIVTIIVLAICVTNPTKNTEIPSDNVSQSQNDNTVDSDTKTDSILLPDTAFYFEYNNTFASMEDYAAQKMKQLIGSTTGHYSLSKEHATATITDAKVYLLEKRGEISNLIPSGTLELWAFHYLVQVDADPNDIILVGGQHEVEDGWYSLLGSDSGYTHIIALRQNDGTYRLLECQTNDSMSLFYNGHRNVAEALYDWGVTHFQLDLPLNCKTFATENGYWQYYWRIDGDGWYFYQFAPSHDYWTQAEDGSFSWTSNLGFTISVTKLDHSAKEEVESLVSLEYMEEEANCIHVKHAKNNTEDYYYDAPEGGCYRVRTDYPTGIAPTVDPEILDIMARSFVMTTTNHDEATRPAITVEPYSDMTESLNEFLSSLDDSALSAITLNKEGADGITYRHPHLADNARFYTNCLNSPYWLAVFTEQSNLPDAEITVTISNGSGAQLTAFQGSKQLLFENSEGRWLLHSYNYEYAENELYVILRGWFDEVEYESLILKYGYDDFTLPDRGQSYLEAGAEGVQILEELHLQVTPGSKYCYSFVDTRVADAEKDLSFMKANGWFPKDYYGFYLYTTFVPENEYARDWSEAGNTTEYEGTGTDGLAVPEDALKYQRCCTAYRADGLWHISIGGTDW